MTGKHTFFLLVVLLAIFGLTAGTAQAAELDVYTNPGDGESEKQEPSPGGGDGWTQVIPDAEVEIPAGGSIFVACRNGLNTDNKKWFKIIVTGDIGKVTASAEGYKTNNTKKKAGKRSIYYGRPNGTLKLECCFTPQPEWERVKLTNNSSNAVNVTIEAWSKCGKTKRDAGEYESETAYHHAVGAVSGASETREVSIFPHNVPVDPGMPASFAAYNGGTWFYDWVYVDPDGEPRPLGGIRFFALDYGLDTGEEYDAEFFMMGDADVMYDVYSFDIMTGEYQVHTQDISHYTPIPDPTYGDGDVNRDNVVDAADLTIALGNYGREDAVWGEGDMDGDNDVDDDDIDIINLNMGRIYL